MARAGDADPQHPGLTRRQRDIVCFCRDHYQRHGYPPTLREIGAAVGLKSTSSVDYQVRELQRKGYLDRPRATRPRTPAMEAPTAQVPPEPGEHGRTLVPVIGRIAAGGPITVVDLPGEYVPVPSSISSPHEHFALEVVGDSMIGKAIISGDRVVVRYLTFIRLVLGVIHREHGFPGCVIGGEHGVLAGFGLRGAGVRRQRVHVGCRPALPVTFWRSPGRAVRVRGGTIAHGRQQCGGCGGASG